MIKGLEIQVAPAKVRAPGKDGAIYDVPKVNIGSDEKPRLRSATCVTFKAPTGDLVGELIQIGYSDAFITEMFNRGLSLSRQSLITARFGVEYDKAIVAGASPEDAGQAASVAVRNWLDTYANDDGMVRLDRIETVGRVPADPLSNALSQIDKLAKAGLLDSGMAETMRGAARAKFGNGQ